MQYRQTINAMSSDHKNQCSRCKADEDAPMRVFGAEGRVLPAPLRVGSAQVRVGLCAARP